MHLAFRQFDSIEFKIPSAVYNKTDVTLILQSHIYSPDRAAKRNPHNPSLSFALTQSLTYTRLYITATTYTNIYRRL